MFRSPDGVCASPASCHPLSRTDLFRYPGRSAAAADQVVGEAGVVAEAVPLFDDGDGGFV